MGMNPTVQHPLPWGKRLANQWCAAFGPVAPVGYMMRKRLASRWVRIHSLPDSKRYPDSHSERAELIRRDEQVASHVLGTRSTCALVLWISPRPRYREKTWGRALQQSELRPFTKCKVNGHGATFHATTLAWKKGAIRRLVKMCADQTAGPIAIANLRKGTAYVPYDGGADLFLSNRIQARLCWSRYTPWLSTHPTRL